MSGGSEIKNVLSLDATKFDAAIEKATTSLTNLDKQLKSASKVAADFEKNFVAVGGDLTGIADKFKLLDQSVTALAARLSGAGSSGFDTVATKTRKAKQGVQELTESAAKASNTLLTLGDVNKRFGAQLDALNPAFSNAAKATKQLSDETVKAGQKVKEATVGQIQDRIKALEAEKKTNAETVESRRRMIFELESLESRTLAAQALAREQFRKQKKKNEPLQQSIVKFGDEAAIVRSQIDQINRIDEGLRYENAQIAQGIELLKKELSVLAEKNAAIWSANAAEEAAMERQAAAEKKALELKTYETGEQKRLNAEMVKTGALAESIVKKMSVGGYKNAGPGWWESQLNAQDKAVAAAERADRKLQESKEKALRAIAASEKKAVAEKAAEEKKAANETARISKELENEQKRAATEAARLAKEVANAQVRAAREAAAERLRVQREQAEAEREQARQAIAMWKGIGALWGASKIEHGLGASVKGADDAERTGVMVKSLGYTDEHNKAIWDGAFDMSKSLKFISTLDAVKSRMSAIASIGEDNAEIIDKTLSTAVKAANNLQFLGQAHGDQQSIIRNLYGVVEMRQQTGDAGATKNTFELIQKIINGTQGKVQTEDMETVLRRLGMGAGQLSDHGMLNLAAVVDQFKVAGGDGGSSGGVSTVGTAFKMMQAYAIGKGKSKEAVKEFAGAGILDTGELDLSQDKANVLRDAKNGSFKDAQLWMADPVAAIQKVMPQIVAYTKRKENIGKFYQGANPEDDTAMLNAVAQYLARLGITTTAATAMMTAGDPRSAKRIGHQVETMSNAKGIDAVDEDAKKTYGRQVQEIGATLDNLKVMVGNSLLPILKDVLHVVGDIVSGFASFAKENPLALQLTTVAVAASGAFLAFKGFASLMGLPSKLGAAFGMLTPALRGAGVEAGAAGSSLLGLGGVTSKLSIGWAEFGKSMRTNVAGAMLATQTGAMTMGGGFSLLGSTVGATAKLIGKSFMAMLPLVGQLLLAWDMAQLLSHVQVGGHEIGEWMGKWLDDIVYAWDLAWLKIVNLVSDRTKEIAKLQADKDGRNAANGFGAKGNERSAAVKQVQMVSSPDIDPTTGKPWTDEDRGLSKKYALGPNAGPHKGPGSGKPDQDISSALTGNQRPQREFENAFQRSYEQMAGRQTIDQLKLGTVISGESSYEAQAKAAFKEKWLGGDFDDGKDPSKRKFLKADAKFNKNKGWSEADLDMGGKDGKSGKTVQQWLEAYAAGKKLEDQVKAVTFAKERASATDEEAAAAIGKLTGETEGQTDAMKALSAEFAREEARNPVGSKQASYIRDKTSAQTSRATADYANMASDLVAKNKEMEGKFLLTERERLQASVDATYEAERKKAQLVMDELDRKVQVEKDIMVGESEAYKKALAARARGEQAFNAYMKNLAKEREEAMLTPIQKMAREWQDTLAQFQSAQVNWANSFADNVSAMLSGSKVSWRKYFADIFADLAKMQTKKALAGLMDSATGKAGVVGIGKSVLSGANVQDGGLLGDWLNKKRGTKDGDKGPGGEYAGVETMFDTFKKSLGEMGTSISDMASKFTSSFGPALDTLWGSLKNLGGGTDAAGDGLMKFAGDAIMKAGSAIWEFVTAVWAATFAENAKSGASAVSGLGGIAGAGTAGASAGVNASAGTASVAAMAANGAYFANQASFFANGGAFTNSIVDSPTLFAFANGGKFGVMGEAGEEAIMPLSRDSNGRLGVTVNGGQAGSGGNVVNISISVASDGTASASGDTASDWSKIANRVKGVVVEELANQQRPGGTLYK